MVFKKIQEERFRISKNILIRTFPILNLILITTIIFFSFSCASNKTVLKEEPIKIQEKKDSIQTLSKEDYIETIILELKEWKGPLPDDMPEKERVKYFTSGERLPDEIDPGTGEAQNVYMGPQDEPSELFVTSKEEILFWVLSQRKVKDKIIWNRPKIRVCDKNGEYKNTIELKYDPDKCGRSSFYIDEHDIIYLFRYDESRTCSIIDKYDLEGNYLGNITIEKIKNEYSPTSLGGELAHAKLIKNGYLYDSHGKPIVKIDPVTKNKPQKILSSCDWDMDMQRNNVNNKYVTKTIVSGLKKIGGNKNAREIQPLIKTNIVKAGIQHVTENAFYVMFYYYNPEMKKYSGGYKLLLCKYNNNGEFLTSFELVDNKIPYVIIDNKENVYEFSSTIRKWSKQAK